MDTQELCKAAVAKWGAQTQAVKFMEEFAELTAEVTQHFCFDKLRTAELAEELVDADIMLRQMCIILNIPVHPMRTCLPDGTITLPEVYKAITLFSKLSFHVGAYFLQDDLRNSSPGADFRQYLIGELVELRSVLHSIRSTLPSGVLTYAHTSKLSKFRDYL